MLYNIEKFQLVYWACKLLFNTEKYIYRKYWDILEKKIIAAWVLNAAIGSVGSIIMLNEHVYTFGLTL